jgi:hypothetical protein
LPKSSLTPVTTHVVNPRPACHEVRKTVAGSERPHSSKSSIRGACEQTEKSLLARTPKRLRGHWSHNPAAPCKAFRPKPNLVLNLSVAGLMLGK